MKTFEEEYKELAEWYFSEQKRLEEESPPWGGVLDGEYTDAMRKLTSEYRMKLGVLREKYGVQTTE